MAKETSRRERIVTGIATVVILAIALWLFVGRSPGGAQRIEVGFGDSVATDAGTVTVLALEQVKEGTRGAPPPADGDEVQAIRFRSCRNESARQIVDLDLFSVDLPGDAPDPSAVGSALTDGAGACLGGRVFVQVPLGASPIGVVYAADPTGVWLLPTE